MNEHNIEILKVRTASRKTITGPRVGDFIHRQDGKLARFTHKWNDGLQTGFGGSYYLNESGTMSFSGGLDPSIPNAEIKETDETREGSAWFFDLNRPGAGRGINVILSCRVYQQTA